jgi:cation diffusion facilitator family transporter
LREQQSPDRLSVSTEGGTKAVIAALISNVGIAISKFIAFAITGSSSMLSEAIHSVADSGNQVLLLIGGHRSKRTANEDHQFGYGRTRFVYGFVVSIVLFIVGGLFAVYEGIHKIQHPDELNDPAIAIGVLLIAMVLEGYSFRTAMREANKSRGRRSLPRYVKDARQPELPVVLLEDFGALIGLSFAMVGVVASTLTGNGVWDGIGSTAIGMLLLVIAVFLATEMASMLIGEGAIPEEQELIRQALEDTPDVDRVIHLKTFHMGPDDLLVAAKIAVDKADSAGLIARAINAAEQRVRDVVPSATYIYLEPDLDRHLNQAEIDPSDSPAPPANETRPEQPESPRTGD